MRKQSTNSATRLNRLIRIIAATLAVVLLFPMTAFAVTDKEENNTIAKAQKMTLGETIDGAITEIGDIDCYTFTISSSGRVTLNMTSYMPYYTLHIYDTEGTELWYSENNEWNSDVGFRKDKYTIDLETGTYYFKVTGYYSAYWIGSSSFASTGTYSVQTAFTNANATETESNNSIAKADYVSLGNTVVGLIGVNDRYDFHAFSINKSGRVTLNMTSYMKYYCLYLYDTEGTQLWYSENNEWNSDVGFRKDKYTIDLEAGTYYLKVTGYEYGSSYASTGTYSIQTAFTSANTTEKESNDSIANANPIALHNTVTGQIAINDRYDCYCFTLDNDDEITLDITSYMQYYSLYIYAPDGSLLWYDERNEWNSTSGYRSDSIELSADAGTYYLKVTGYYDDWHTSSSYASTGKYEFTIISPNALANSWVKYDGEWYYFDADCNPVTGWLLDGGKWYYFDSYGVMQTGWVKISGVWYYMEPSGAMATGWQLINGQYYYFYSSGVMKTGWLNSGGKRYFFRPDGAMATGWVQSGGKWYFMNESGAMQSGWLKRGNAWYYLNASGVMQTGWVKVGSSWYYMNGSGVMQTGWLKLSGKWYYLNSSGAMVTGTVKINGVTYKFSPSGVWIP